MHDCRDLIRIFNHCFELKYNTRLMKGDEEPLYLPAEDVQSHHTIYFAHGFFSSALHECAHWFVAGTTRRTQIDYGYWYVPDGRTAKQQTLFQQVEVKPQAIEWILSEAAGYKFQFSIDNLNGVESDTLSFKQAVYQQVLYYCKQGLSKRADQFRTALCSFYNTCHQLSAAQFKVL